MNRREMKKIVSHPIMSIMTLVVILAGCNRPKVMPTAAKKYHKMESFGQLPAFPASLGNPNIYSLVEMNGNMPSYRVKENSQIRDGETMSCEIKAGEIIEAIADAESALLVHAQRSSLARECENSGKEDFVEGYLDKSVLELVSLPKEEESEDSEESEPTSPDQLPPGVTVSSSEEDDSGSPAPESPSTAPAPPPVNSNAAPENPKPPNVPSSPAQPNPTPAQPNPPPAQVETPQCKSVKIGQMDDLSVNDMTATLWGDTLEGRIPGDTWRLGAKQYFLQVKGVASKWKVQAFWKAEGHEMKAKTFESSSLKRGSKNSYKIKFADFVRNPNEWFSASITIVITPVSASGKTGKACKQKVTLLSPLVLDFSGEKMITTKSILESSSKFDLDADGITEDTGWVKGNQAAFLVLDRNKNGRIDDGGELFGDATLQKDKKTLSRDGFHALAQFDENSDGRIDGKDPIFNSLALWFDRNENGKTDAGELEQLNQRQVSWISLTYERLPRSQALQHTNSLIPNDVRMKATFGASGCPKAGCNLYDIYFGSFSSRIVGQK